jgi:hypothetical protein
MANKDNDGDRRDLPLPVFIGGVVLIIVVAGLIIWHFVGANGPTETSDVTRMSAQERLRHFEEVRKSQPKGVNPFSREGAGKQAQPAQGGDQGGAQGGAQGGGATAPQ